jgi:NADH-quinone oxidoreductase subunit N
VVIAAPPLDYGALAPLLIVLAGAGIALLLDLVIPPARRAWLGYFAAGTAVVALVAATPLWREERLAFSNMVAIDRFGVFVSVVILAATALSILLAIDFLDDQGLNYGEYYPLVLMSAAGMLLLAVANDLIVLFLGLEVLSIGLYILSGFARGRVDSEESALKYFLLGSFALGFLVYGTALVYGAAGTTNFAALAAFVARNGAALHDPLLLAGVALILVGLAFKLALVPFHMWTPDVYYGAPTPVTAFMSVGTKVATFAALARLVVGAVPQLRDDWARILWSLAIITMLAGNLAAVTQRNIKRLLAYSSIGQAGYILVAVIAAASPRPEVRDEALSGILFYLLAYTFMNLGAFAVAIALARPDDERLDIDTEYAGLARRRPWLAAALTIFMLSLGGVPPTAGFMAKVFVFRAAIDAGYWQLALVGVLTSVLALAFYLRVIVVMYTRDPARPEEPPERVPATVAVVLAVCVVLTLAFGILPAGALDLTSAALAAGVP